MSQRQRQSICIVHVLQEMPAARGLCQTLLQKNVLSAETPALLLAMHDSFFVQRPIGWPADLVRADLVPVAQPDMKGMGVC